MKYINNFKVYSRKLKKHLYIGDTVYLKGFGLGYKVEDISRLTVTLHNECENVMLVDTLVNLDFDLIHSISPD